MLNRLPETSCTASSVGDKCSVSLATIVASMSADCEAGVDSDRRPGRTDLDGASRFASDGSMLQQCRHVFKSVVVLSSRPVRIMRILRAVFPPAFRLHVVSRSPTSILRSHLVQRPPLRQSHTLSLLRTQCLDIKGFGAIRLPDSRLLSTSTVQPEADVSKLPVLASPAVGRWLLFSSALVFAVIVVGGVTRLTESGLSITEWRPITGIIPPLSDEDWNTEFEKYKATPEFKLSEYSSSAALSREGSSC